jgi:acyl-CoA oxidase
MTKAYVTERGREIVKWGREILGGNGIIHENFLMKAFNDMEALYTYEGSYDINTLVAGREVTGLSAIKPARK